MIVKILHIGLNSRITGKIYKRLSHLAHLGSLGRSAIFIPFLQCFPNLYALLETQVFKSNASLYFLTFNYTTEV